MQILVYHYADMPQQMSKYQYTPDNWHSTLRYYLDQSENKTKEFYKVNPGKNIYKNHDHPSKDQVLKFPYREYELYH